MLGLADRGRVLDLFDLILKGDARARWPNCPAICRGRRSAGGAARSGRGHALGQRGQDHARGAEDPTIGPDERDRGRAMAEALPMRVLTRMWQMLLKALEEVAMAPNAMMAAEMA
jgi:DNA polymerase-3 subunit gamma/tau